ncbi:MAG TPA: glycosyltransferase, partial [bacterium]|nr:glycosyltransferase [bacterium]
MNPRKTKIMFITPWLKTGGAERMIVDLSIGLDKTRYEVLILLFNQEGTDPEIWLPELEEHSIKIIRVNRSKRINAPVIGGVIRLLQLLFAVKQVISKEKPDIVQTQLFG